MSPLGASVIFHGTHLFVTLCSLTSFSLVGGLYFSTTVSLIPSHNFENQYFVFWIYITISVNSTFSPRKMTAHAKCTELCNQSYFGLKLGVVVHACTGDWGRRITAISRAAVLHTEGREGLLVKEAFSLGCSLWCHSSEQSCPPGGSIFLDLRSKFLDFKDLASLVSYFSARIWQYWFLGKEKENLNAPGCVSYDLKKLNS